VTALDLAPEVETAPSPVRPDWTGRWWPWIPPALAATVAVVGAALGWRGVDLAAQV
jgi:hypothetical protein